METLETLRQINIMSSLLATGITAYLLFIVYKRFKQTEGRQRRVTGATLLGVTTLLFINSTLLLTTFISIAVTYNADFISIFSNFRVLLINSITIIISIIILLIEKGKI